MTVFRAYLTLCTLGVIVSAQPCEKAKAQDLMAPAAKPSAIASNSDRGNAAIPIATAPQSDASPTVTNLKVLGIFSKDAMDRRNPLWGVPLAAVIATRERPIFAPTRRPPPSKGTLMQPSVIKQPDTLPFTLVGVISEEKDGIALFRDESTKAIIRLRLGDSHSGWLLERVTGRDATLRRNGEIATLALPAPITQ